MHIFYKFYKHTTENIIKSLTNEMCNNLKIYFYEIKKHNKMFNLISFKNDEELIYRHFCDSIYATKIIKNIIKNNNYSKTLNIIDLGSGSGLPGIPVKITLPYANVTLVESITKKCIFLKNVKNKIGINIEILNKRAEEIGQQLKHRQKYDFVLSRAVSKLSPNLEISIPLLKIGGYFIVYKTKESINKDKNFQSIKNALNNLNTTLKKIFFYNLPKQKLDYCILIFKKNKKTPKKFPRKIGIPTKFPL
jgi:16S rRNA (guanine527-N7)-methyltransferase